MHHFVIVSIRLFDGVFFHVFVIVDDCATAYVLTDLLSDLCYNFITSFDFLFSISSTLGDFYLATSDRITLGDWLAVTDTLGGDAVLLVSYHWGGWNMF